MATVTATARTVEASPLTEAEAVMVALLMADTASRATALAAATVAEEATVAATAALTALNSVDTVPPSHLTTSIAHSTKDGE